MIGHLFDRDGIPIELLTFVQLCGNRPYRKIGLTRVTDLADVARAFEVSTVWLGIDQDMGGDGPPLIFETMVFTEVGPADCFRYATLPEARQGHAATVVAIAAVMTDPTVFDVDPEENEGPADGQ